MPSSREFQSFKAQYLNICLPQFLLLSEGNGCYTGRFANAKKLSTLYNMSAQTVRGQHNFRLASFESA